LLLEFTKTIGKRWLVERVGPLSIAVLLMIGADFPSFALKSAQHSSKLPPVTGVRWAWGTTDWDVGGGEMMNGKNR
jgi:hypothetical protein